MMNRIIAINTTPTADWQPERARVVRVPELGLLALPLEVDPQQRLARVWTENRETVTAPFSAAEECFPGTGNIEKLCD